MILYTIRMIFFFKSMFVCTAHKPAVTCGQKKQCSTTLIAQSSFIMLPQVNQAHPCSQDADCDKCKRINQTNYWDGRTTWRHF